jgi:hypothetical protein
MLVFSKFLEPNTFTLKMDYDAHDGFTGPSFAGRGEDSLITILYFYISFAYKFLKRDVLYSQCIRHIMVYE